MVKASARKRLFARKIRSPMSVRRRRQLARNPTRVATVGTVKRMIQVNTSRQAENKVAYYESTRQTFNNALTLADFSSNQVIPSVTQGTGLSNRLANVVRMKGCYIKGSVNVNFPISATSQTFITSNYLYVRILILLDKNQPAVGVGTSSVLCNADAAVAPTGLVKNVTDPVDKIRFQVLYDKKIRLQNANMQSNFSGAFNPNFASQRFFRCKIPGRVLKYLDGMNTTPNNFNPQLGMFLVDPLQVLTPGSTGTAPATFEYQSVMYYEDM